MPLSTLKEGLQQRVRAGQMETRSDTNKLEPFLAGSRLKLGGHGLLS